MAWRLVLHCWLALALFGLPASAQQATGHDIRARHATLSADGRRIAIPVDAIGRDRQAVFIYDTHSDQLRIMPVPREWVLRSAALSPAADRVAATVACHGACPSSPMASGVLELSLATRSWRTVLMGSGRRFHPAYAPNGDGLLLVHTEGGPPRRDGREANACQVLVWVDLKRGRETPLMPRDDCFYLIGDATIDADGNVAFSARSPWGEAKRKQARDLDLPGGVMALIPWRAKLADRPDGTSHLTALSVIPALARDSDEAYSGSLFLTASLRDVTAIVAIARRVGARATDLAEYDVFLSRGAGAPVRLTHLRTYINDLAISADASTILIRVDENRGVYGDFHLIDVATGKIRALGLVPRMSEVMRAN